MKLSKSEPIRVFYYGRKWCAAGTPITGDTGFVFTNHMKHFHLGALEAMEKARSIMCQANSDTGLLNLLLSRGYLLPDLAITPVASHDVVDSTLDDLMNAGIRLEFEYTTPVYIPESCVYPGFNTIGQPVVTGIRNPKLLTIASMTKWWERKLADIPDYRDYALTRIPYNTLIAQLVALHQLRITRMTARSILTDPARSIDDEYQRFKAINKFVNRARTEYYTPEQMKIFRRILRKMNYHRVITSSIWWYSGESKQEVDMGTASTFPYLPGSLDHVLEAYDLCVTLKESINREM